ncbi:ribonuclease H family protein [Psychroflexus sp. CAK57W]|uniref:ribonuclease H1 domain-containing protein n=1 Tax=Psychroflexus curvus TaxID=2873595 RepID=UPI001CCF3B6E|nr:ribonuclease H family protein [Psychroflexus curvus]MBZ9627116.1 ribonuclease H family protein [Psychroflexus curvus]MBZ9787122.1 ribonuclease H family protein [Psychroflexus curvus]
MSKSSKYYVVWEGFEPGIYSSWQDCKLKIQNYPNAKYKSFSSLEEAKDAYNMGFFTYQKQKKANSKAFSTEGVEWNSIAVDAASSGNPGKMEYRGVVTKTKQVLFHMGPFPNGTNNIGEFLALVHGLAFLKAKKSELPIYTDSRIAMSWIRQKKCKTKLAKNSRNEELFELIKRAEIWLKKNSFKTPILKWETKAWGEIPADFGRK